MQSGGDEERLFRLRERLYQREGEGLNLRRSRPSSAPRGGGKPTAGAWRQRGLAGAQKVENFIPGGSRLWRRVFWFSLAFFILAVIVAGLTFLRGWSSVSVANVDLAIEGPREIKAGSEAIWQVKVTNRNQTPLESVNLLVEYPPMSQRLGAGGALEALTRERLPLGNLAAGESSTETLRAAVFGEQNSLQTIKVVVEYRLADSNAIFDKTASASAVVTATPLLLNVTLPPAASSQQEIVGQIEVVSNVGSVLNGVAVIINYPPGFIFRSAEPAPAIGNYGWRLGDLAAGGKRQISFRGVLAGQDNDLKAFQVSAGLPASGNDHTLAVVYSSIFQTVAVERPFVDLTMAVNGNARDEVVVPVGESLRVDLSWINNLPDEISDGQLTVRLAGILLDRRSVTTSNGFYQSNDGTVSWNRQTMPALARLLPAATGATSFNFSTASLADLRSLAGSSVLPSEPVIELEASFQGRRLAADGKTETVSRSRQVRLKVQSVFQLSGQTWQRGGPLANTGPIPPRVGQETTYTISWAVGNALNDVTEASVAATLPSYVRWLDVVSPAEENISFDTDTGRIIWQLGTVRAGTGWRQSPREVSFRVALTPSLSQLGTAPELVTRPALTGRDVFTGTTLTHEIKSLTTSVSDPDSRFGDEKVVDHG